jgi:release factor glutamine methyltransferase
MKTIQQLMDAAMAKLREAAIPSARLDCLILLEDALTKDRTWLLAHPEHMPTSEQYNQFNKQLSQRANHTPLAYIRGKSQFYGREFELDSSVLIPRPESEQMIEEVKQLAKTHDLNTIIDFGTGSGCLAITIKAELPNARVFGFDISNSALKIAARNARKHTTAIRWRKLDIFTDDFPESTQTESYIIMANLPYVPDGVITSPEITMEPALALFSGQDGLNHYRALFGQLTKVTQLPTAVVVESLESQHAEINQLAHAAGFMVTKTTGLIQVLIPSPNQSALPAT